MPIKLPELPKPTLWNYIESFIRWCFGLTAIVCNSILIIGVSFICKFEHLQFFLHAFSKQMLWISGIKLKVSGLENFDSSKPYIFIFNHTNVFDHFVIFPYMPAPTRGIEKESHFHWPFYGAFLKRIGQIPIQPKGNTESAIASLEVAKKFFREKKMSIAIAPEGTRTKDGYLGKFKKGAFHLAIDLQAQIVPIFLFGMYEYKQKGNWIVRPREVSMVFEKPIDTTGLTKKDVFELWKKTYEMYCEKLPAR